MQMGELPRWLDFKAFAKAMHLTEGTLRGMTHRAKELGFDRCIRKVGRKLFFDSYRYNEWVDSHLMEGEND